MVIVNISGITSTMPSIDMQYSGTTQGTSPVQETGSVSAPEPVNVGMEASVAVMDMANGAFEDAARQLIDSMAQMTGVGQNFDAVV